MKKILTLLLVLVLVGCSSQSQQVKQSASLVAPNILLFNGTGTTSTDVAAVEAVLLKQALPYTTANSYQLNHMTESQMKAYKLLIVPGGNSITIGNNLTKATTANIRTAVQRDGLHYLGICAGAFLAGDGNLYNNINLAGGKWFSFYSAYSKGIRIASENLILADSSRLDVYWQDGPQLNGWGNIVAKYPDGTAAIVEGYSGVGWMILAGIHAEAPAGWRTCCVFTTPLATDLAYAGAMIKAALNDTPLQHF